MLYSMRRHISLYHFSMNFFFGEQKNDRDWWRLRWFYQKVVVKKRERDFHEVIKAFTGKLSRIERLGGGMPMRKCHFQLIISLNAITSWWRQKILSVCTKQENTFTWNAPTHTNNIAGKYRELFGTMLISFFFAIYCYVCMELLVVVT